MDNNNNNSYDELSSLIKRVYQENKSNNNEEEPIKINISSIFSNEENYSDTNYSILVNEIKKLDSGFLRGNRVNNIYNPIAPSTYLLGNTVINQKLANQNTGIINSNIRIRNNPKEQPKGSHATTTLNIKELVKNINQSELVLPTLPLSDQISEINRIIEGLKMSIFDQSHIEIVIQEIYGLKEISDKEKKDLGSKISKLSPTEKSLINMREDKLNYALKLINQINGQRDKGS